MKRKISLLLCVCLFFCLLPLRARAEGAPISVSSPSAILTSGDGKVLFEKNAHEKRPIASVTKVMTLLLVFEALDAGELTLSEVVTASEHACSMGGSQIWLSEKDRLTAEEMIKAVVICSANDCAVALAERPAGTEDAFVAKMNERASELSMGDTHFENACGLPEEGHLSSAYDVAVMSRELIKHEKIKEYTVIWQDTLRGGEFTMTNTNKLIRTFRGMTGLKTGYTSDAGYCLSATAERDGLSLCAVALGADSSDGRNGDVAAMLEYGFASFISVDPTPDAPLTPVKVLLGESSYAVLRLGEHSPLTVEKAKAKSMVKTVETAESVKAPVTEGQKVGELKVTLDGETLAVIPIVTAHSVERLGFFGILKKIMRVSCMK